MISDRKDQNLKITDSGDAQFAVGVNNPSPLPLTYIITYYYWLS